MPAVARARADVVAALQRRELSAAIVAVRRLSAAVHRGRQMTPEHAADLAGLGDLQLLLRDYGAAKECYTEALQLLPAESLYWCKRAAVRRFLGELEDAESDYDRAILLAHDNAQAYLSRSELRMQVVGRNHIAELEAALRDGPPTWRFAVPICYALAKEYEDLGDYTASWRNLTAGAGLRRRHLQYDIRTDLLTFDWIRRAFPKPTAAAADGCPSAEPIFIVGLPRTGSTVVDRILGSHTDVASAGELPDFTAAVLVAVHKRFGMARSRQELIAASSALDFAALGADYVRGTRPRTGGTRYFTDKLPMNFLYCGLIARALPRARIIHVTRHPVANCYAMFKVLFDQGYPFSYELGELGHYYLGYRKLMSHWHETLPGRIVDVAYEDLVASSDREVARLLEILGLPWQRDCVDFHLNPAPVATASAAQVRRPLYSTGVSAWRNFESGLAPLAARLRAAGVPVD